MLSQQKICSWHPVLYAGESKLGKVVIGTPDMDRVRKQINVGKMKLEGYLFGKPFYKTVEEDNRNNKDGGWNKDNENATITKGLEAELDRLEAEEKAASAESATEAAAATTEDTTETAT